MDFTLLFIAIATGLGFAAIYVLIAISFTLVLASSGVFNFAQSIPVVLAGIAAYLLSTKGNWPALAVVAAVLVVGGLCGMVTYGAAVMPALSRGNFFTETTLLTTIGLGTAVSALIAHYFGSEARPVESYVTSAPLSIFGAPLRPIYLTMVVLAIVISLSVDRVMRKSQVGHVFRVTLEDRDGAQLLGVNVRRVMAYTFVIAGALAAFAGFLIAPVTGASAFSAQNLALYGFAGMTIGGFGSFSGALVGGVIVGMITGITPAYANPALATPLVWFAMVIILLIRPSGIAGAGGLFGAAASREV